MKKIIIVTGMFMFIFSINVLRSQIMQDTLLTINFENGSDSMISYYNVSGTPWQKGKPQKTILDSAFNAPNGIITDTIDPYLPGTYSYFEIPFMPNDYGTFGSSNFVCPLMICFEHRSDWDSTAAGGWLSVRDNDEYLGNFSFGSWDYINGSSYFYHIFDLTEVIDPWSYMSIGYDTLFNDTLGFSMSNPNWRKTCLNMYWLALGSRANDTLFYRFSFQADTVPNVSHGGWLIDEIQIGQGTGTCSGSVEENNNSRVLLYPNPGDEWLYISTIGSFEKGFYQLLDLNGKLIQEQSIVPADQIPISIADIPVGVYLMKLNLDNKSYTKRFIKIR